MKVVLTDSAFDPARERQWASTHGHELIASQCKSAQDVVSLAADADVVLTQFAKIDALAIRSMQKARAIVRYGIGVDNVDLEAARVADIPVCNVPDYCIDEVADHTLAFMLALLRGTVSNSTSIKAGQWRLAWPVPLMRTMKTQTVGIIGFGRIGREVARRVVAFKGKVLVYDPVVPAAAVADAGCTSVSLEDLLAQSDLVTIHCPSNAQTRNLLNRERLNQARRGAMIVNVGRGDLLDPDALVEALASGQVAAAALDVMAPEPIPAGHPLLANDKVILSSHVASVSAQAIEKLHGGVLQTAEIALAGKLPPNIVNGIRSPRTV